MQNPFLKYLDDERKQTMMISGSRMKSNEDQVKSRDYQSSVMLRGTHTLFDKYNSNRVNAREIETIVWSDSK